MDVPGLVVSTIHELFSPNPQARREQHNAWPMLLDVGKGTRHFGPPPTLNKWAMLSSLLLFKLVTLCIHARVMEKLPNPKLSRIKYDHFEGVYMFGIRLG